MLGHHPVVDDRDHDAGVAPDQSPCGRGVGDPNAELTGGGTGFQSGLAGVLPTQHDEVGLGVPDGWEFRQPDTGRGGIGPWGQLDQEFAALDGLENPGAPAEHLPHSGRVDPPRRFKPHPVGREIANAVVPVHQRYAGHIGVLRKRGDRTGVPGSPRVGGWGNGEEREILAGYVVPAREREQVAPVGDRPSLRWR